MSASSGESSILNWPEPCSCSLYIPCLRLSELPADIKAYVWNDLKLNNPAKADCLLQMSRDMVVKGLIAEFDASLTLTRDDLSTDAHIAVKDYFE